MDDMVTKGRSRSGDCHFLRLHPDRVIRGERHVNAKLTEDDVREIRRLYAAGIAKQQGLAERFGVSQVKVSQILLRKSWRHVA